MPVPFRTLVAIIIILVISGAPSAFAQTRSPAATQARDAIQEVTLRALTTLQDVNLNSYLAVLHPDYQAIDTRGRKYTKAQVKETMGALLKSRRLGDARTTLGSVKLTRMSDGSTTATIYGEERLVWYPMEVLDTPETVDEGTSAPPAPRQERLAVTTQYRRVWVRGKQGWLLLRSRTLSEKSASLP